MGIFTFYNRIKGNISRATIITAIALGISAYCVPASYGAGENLSSAPLATTVVTANKYQTDLFDTPQSISVITAEQIEHSPARTVAELLNTIPGVNLENYGGPGAMMGIGIRGSTNSQVLILINGHKLNNALGYRLNDVVNGGFDMSNIPVPLSQIERIEILRGEASTLYGSDAMAGVINIITKQISDATTTVRLAGASYNGSNIAVSTQQKMYDNMNLMAAYNNENSNGYRYYSAYNNNIYNAGIQYGFSPLQTISFSANHINKNIQIPGDNHLALASGSQNEQNTNIGITYTDTSFQWMDIRGSYTLNDNNLFYKDFFTPIPEEHRNRTNIIDLQGDMYLSDTNILNAGIMLQTDNATSTNIGSKGYTTFGGFVQENYIFNNIKSNVGVRYDNNSVFGPQLSPEMGILYHLNTNTSVKMTAGYGYHAPTLNDLYYQTTSLSLIGNPNLVPETSANIDIGLNTHNDNSSLDISLYGRRVNNLIQWIMFVLPPASTQFYQPQNIVQANIYGVEADYHYRINKDTSFIANYTLTIPKNAQNDTYLTNIDIHKAVLGLDFVSFWDVTAGLNSVFESRCVSSPGVNQAVTQEWVTVNLKLSKNIETYKVYISANNMFNAQYDNIPGYPAAPTVIEAGVSGDF